MVDGALDRAQNGQRADTVEENSRGEPLSQIGAGELPHKALEAAVQVSHGAQETSGCQAQDKEHWVLAVGEVSCHSIDSQNRGGQTHGVIKCALVFFFDSFSDDTSDQAASEYGACVDNGSNHIVDSPCEKYFYT